MVRENSGPQAQALQHILSIRNTRKGTSVPPSDGIAQMSTENKISRAAGREKTYVPCKNKDQVDFLQGAMGTQTQRNRS